MCRRVVAAKFIMEFVYKRSLDEVYSLIGSFIQKYFSSYDNLEVGWFLLAQLACDTTFVQSPCEYLMAYSCLMVDIFL